MYTHVHICERVCVCVYTRANEQTIKQMRQNVNSRYIQISFLKERALHFIYDKYDMYVISLVSEAQALKYFPETVIFSCDAHCDQELYESYL